MVDSGKQLSAGSINLKALTELIPYQLHDMSTAQFLVLQTALKLFLPFRFTSWVTLFAIT
jgi:hypothetical protein